jgi:hypothetical protein
LTYSIISLKKQVSSNNIPGIHQSCVTNHKIINAMKKLILHKFVSGIILFALLLSSSSHLTAQPSSNVKYPQYLFPEFSEGVIKFKTGQRQIQKINYNTISEKMVFQKDDKNLDMTNVESIDTIIIQERVFVHIDKSFYEVLVNAPVTLFLQHKSDLIEQGTPSGYGGVSQTSAINVYSSANLAGRTYNMEVPAEYTLKPSPVYWIREGDKFSSFLTIRQLQKILSKENSEVKNFINQNHIKIENKEGLIKLVKFYNEKILTGTR